MIVRSRCNRDRAALRTSVEDRCLRTICARVRQWRAPHRDRELSWDFASRRRCMTVDCDIFIFESYSEMQTLTHGTRFNTATRVRMTCRAADAYLHRTTLNGTPVLASSPAAPLHAGINALRPGCSPIVRCRTEHPAHLTLMLSPCPRAHGCVRPCHRVMASELEDRTAFLGLSR